MIYCVKPMMTNKTLLTEIERFLERHAMAPSSFGRLFLGNPNFVFDLELETYEVKLKTVNKVIKAMQDYKPGKGKKDGR